MASRSQITMIFKLWESNYFSYIRVLDREFSSYYETVYCIFFRHREEPSRLPVYGRAFRRKNWSENKDVNMSLMTFSRIILPVIFCIFNACYWGAAIV